jgi:hypothetical protein
VAVHEE